MKRLVVSMYMIIFCGTDDTLFSHSIVSVSLFLFISLSLNDFLLYHNNGIDVSKVKKG